MANPFRVGTAEVTGTGTSRTIPVAFATSAGDTLLVAVVVNNTTCIPSACSDSQGNVYTLDKSFTSTLPTLYAYRSPGATGGSGGGATTALTTSDTIIVTTNAVSGNVGIFCTDAPGVGAVDQIATITTGTSITPSVSATPTAANEICVSYFGTANGGGTPTVNSPYTTLGSLSNGSNPFVTMAYDVLTGGSGVAQTSTLTITSAAWRAGMWTFNPGSGSTPKSGADTGSGADTATLAAALAGADTGSGTDLASIGVTGTDTGSGADTATLAAHISGADTGSGADTATLAAALAGADTGSGTDLASVTVPVSAADTGSGADTATVAVPVSAADTASGADTATVAVAVTGTDTASGADSASTPGAQGCRADTDGSVLDAGITTTATTAQVDTSTPGDPLWTTDPSQVPLDILVAGERITVTTISGTTSPQTFTIKRSINGVVKAHAAGEPVALFTPCYFALA